MPVMEHWSLPTLRQILREATAAEHDRLDSSVTQLDFTQAADYRRFLSLQLAARRPIEAWLTSHPPMIEAPPALASLIVEDLADLGSPLAVDAPFDPPSRAGAIGACWAIAGSSLGNRAMHRELLRAAPNAPARFLADAAMTGYWQRLKPILETAADADQSLAAVSVARAVFASFLAAAEQYLRPEPAS